MESEQPFGTDFVRMTAEGLTFGMSQNRGVSVHGEIGLKALTVAMEDFSQLNPEAAKSIAFIMLGTAAKQDLREK